MHTMSERQLRAVKKGIPGSQVGERELLVGSFLSIELWGGVGRAGPSKAPAQSRSPSCLALRIYHIQRVFIEHLLCDGNC